MHLRSFGVFSDKNTLGASTVVLNQKLSWKDGLRNVELLNPVKIEQWGVEVQVEKGGLLSVDLVFTLLSKDFLRHYTEYLGTSRVD